MTKHLLLKALELINLKNIYYLLAICLLPIAYTVPAFAQVDTDFWLAIPYVTDAHDHSQTYGYGQLCITTFGDTAHVTISQPGVTSTADPFYFAPMQRTILPNSFVDIPVGSGSLNRAKPNGLCPYGVHVESDAPITVYFAQTNNNSEIYTYKGTNALGTSFLVGMQKQHSNAFSASPSIDILATEDNTTVSIITPVTTRNSPSSTQITVTLQKGQIYTVQSKDASTANHLGGTVITSNKPVCVNSNDDSVNAGGQDLVGEQLVPADLAGSEYIAIRHNAGQSEKLFLYTFPNQPITYTVGNGAPQTLAGGSMATVTLSSTATYISADQPFVCFQLTGEGTELGGTILPRLDCTGSSEVVFKKRFDTQKIDLMVRTQYTSSFVINGTPQTLSFQAVPNAPGWSYCELSSPSFQNGIIRIANTQAIFHSSYLDYGGGGTCSYGYFSGYNHISLFASSDKTVYLQGETINLSVADAPLFTNIVWTFPDGTTHTGASVTNIAEDATDAGTYTVTAESTDGCPVELEYNTVMVFVQGCPDPVTQTENVIVCDTLLPYLWRGQSLAAAGTYYDTLTTTLPGGAECDSIYYVLNLTLNHCEQDPCPNPNIIEEYTAICDTLLPQEWHNQMISEPGTYTDSVGCDIYIVHLSTYHCERDTTPRLTVETTTKSVNICDGDDSFVLNYKVIEGTPNLLKLSMGGDSVQIPVPASVEQPPYEVSLPITFTEEMAAMLSPLTSPAIVDIVFFDTATFTYSADSVPSPLVSKASRIVAYILYDPEKIFAQKWNNVLAIFSPEYSGYNLELTTDYQWYRNGQPVAGATGSYYRIGEYGEFDVDDYYQAEVTRVSDGVRMLTCPYYPHVPSYQAPEEEKASKVLMNQHIYIKLGDKLFTLEGFQIE